MKKIYMYSTLLFQVCTIYSAKPLTSIEHALQQRETKAREMLETRFQELKARTLEKADLKTKPIIEQLIDLYEEIVKYINTNVKKPEAAYVYYPHIENVILPKANAYLKEMIDKPRLSFNRDLKEEYKEWVEALEAIDLILFTQYSRYKLLQNDSRKFFVKLHAPLYLQGETIGRNALQAKTEEVFQALQNPEENLQRVENFYREQAKQRTVTSPKTPARRDQASPLIVPSDPSAAGAARATSARLVVPSDPSATGTARARKVSILDLE